MIGLRLTQWALVMQWCTRPAIEATKRSRSYGSDEWKVIVASVPLHFGFSPNCGEKGHQLDLTGVWKWSTSTPKLNGLVN